MDAAMYGAVLASFGYVEDEACMTRLGSGGTAVVRGGGLVAAFFPHDMSRELDPQYHIHAVTFNFTRGPDGKYRSLDASKLYEHKHAAGALFRAELAARLEKLGFEIERDRFSFSIKGVPESLKEEFSKRAEQIRKELGEKEATQKQKDKAAVSSRQAKPEHIDRDKLIAEWREVGERHGFTAERVAELRTHVKPKERDERAELRAAVSEALKQLTSSKSSFTERKLIEQTAIEGQTRGLFANEIRHEVFAELERARRGIRDAQVVRLGDHRDGYERFTTRELFKLEQEIIQTAERGRGSIEHCVSDKALRAALAAKPTLSAEQVEAAYRITQNAGNVQCVRGWAGTGKTYMVDAARLALEAAGYTVLGCALSGKAAKELSKGANIECSTIAKLIYDLDHPGRKDRLTLDAKTILVVDEAGMVGTRALHRLITEVERAGARLVLVGDDKQLQSIDAGGGFLGLSKRLGYAELKEITRQRHAADRQAVYDMAEGNPGAALKSYARARPAYPRRRSGGHDAAACRRLAQGQDGSQRETHSFIDQPPGGRHQQALSVGTAKARRARAQIRHGRRGRQSTQRRSRALHAKRQAGWRQQRRPRDGHQGHDRRRGATNLPGRDAEHEVEARERRVADGEAR